MPTSKPIADVACIIRTGENVTETALRQAVKLASAHGAHLTVRIAVQQLATPYSPFWMSLPQALVTDLNAKTRMRGEQAVELARSAAQIAGVNADVEMILDKAGNAAEQAVLALRATDLIVVDQPDAVMDSKATVLEEALFRSGRPILVATPRREPMGVPARAAIAWDGSDHAARATAGLLALFPGLARIDIVVVQGEKDLSRFLPGAELARHLSRKGVEANLVELSAKGGPIWKLIDDHAAAQGCDLVTMGGYGHSRLREFILGGVTESIIRQASVPLLMAF